MNLLEHFESEWEIAFGPSRGKDTEADKMQDLIKSNIKSLLQLFAGQGHSGSSAQYCLAYLNKAIQFEPFTPLTGADSEWGEPHESDERKLQQNKRYGKLFKEGERAFVCDAIVFAKADNVHSLYTNKFSFKDVTFPYVPQQPQYVTIIEDCTDEMCCKDCTKCSNAKAIV